MKKVVLAISGLVIFSVSSISLADNHTLSVGYAQSKVSDFKDIRGVNLQYRYEWDFPISVSGSFAYMSGDNSFSEYSEGSGGSKRETKDQADLKYYSLLAGPAWRINSYASLYALAGVAYTDAKTSLNTYTVLNGIDNRISSHASGSWKSASFSYGAGVLINPIENLSVNIGYEGTRVKIGDFKHAIDGFNIGVGYRF